MSEPDSERRSDLDEIRARLRVYAVASRLMRRSLFPVGLVLSLIAVGLAFEWLAPRSPDGRLHPLALLLGGAKSTPLLRAGEWWRLFASLFLHAGVAHLAVNCIGAYFLGQLAENVFGTARAWLLFVWGGVAGGLASALWTPEASVGASGAIFSLFGALLAFALSRRRSLPPAIRRFLWVAATLWAALSVAQAIETPLMDHAAHAGGFLAGVAFSRWFGADLPVAARVAGPATRAWRLAASGTLAVVLIAQGLAFRSLSVGPAPSRPPLESLALNGVTVPVPMDWAHGRWADTCIEDPAPPAEVIRAGGVACFHDAYGTVFLVGRARDLLAGTVVDPNMTLRLGLRIPIEERIAGVVRQALALDRDWAIALIGFEVIQPRYDAFLRAVITGIAFR